MGEDTDELFTMSVDKVRTLAWLVHLQEARHARTTPFRSSNHRTQYLRDSRRTYESAIGILDSLEKAVNENQDDEDLSKVLHYLYEFASLGVGFACKTLWGLHFREVYLKKLRGCADHSINNFINILSATELTHDDKLLRLDEIIQVLAENKQVWLDRMERYENPNTRNFSHFWNKLRHRSDNMFEHMVSKYKGKVFPEPTHETDPEMLLKEKAQIYEEILASSGNPTYPKLARFAKGAALAFIVFQLGMIVWDTCESGDHWKSTLAKDTTTLVVSFGAGLAGEFIGTAAATAAFGAMGLATTTIIGSGIVMVASVATGFGAAILAGVLVGLLFEKLFDSGGEGPKKTVPHHPSTEHLIPHFTPVVDGVRLARQLTAASCPKA